MATTARTDEIDPVRDLNNYLQEVKKGQNLTQYLVFSSQQTGSNDKAVHTGTYTFRSVPVGTGRDTTKAAAKRRAAAKALEYFEANGVE